VTTSPVFALTPKSVKWASPVFPNFRFATRPCSYMLSTYYSSTYLRALRNCSSFSDFSDFLAKTQRGGAPQSPCFGSPFTIPSLSPGDIPSMRTSALAVQGKGNRYSQHIDLRTATVRLRRGEAQAGRAPARPSVTQKFLRVTQHSTSTFFGHTIVSPFHASM
jgi:hypothetical protein